MQDKEIDHLFRSGLDGLEVEPSDRVWGGIRAGLDGRKKQWKVYLGIAASLLILLSAGLYFISNIKDNVKKPLQLTAAKINKPANTVTEPVIKTPKVEQVKPAKVNAELAMIATSRKQKVKNVAKPGVLPGPPTEILQPATQMAQTVQKPADDIKFVVPDKQIPLNEKVPVTDDVPAINTGSLAVQPVTDTKDTKSIAAAPVKKHRIRNLGDLINVVVSKVDKRKDKLIEFSDTKDEDESIVSGLNLGFIKIKKQD